MKYLFPLAILLSTQAIADIQTIHVRAESPTSLMIGQSLASSMVITDAEIKSKNYRTVYEAIRSVPGVDIVTPSPGQNATVFIRGAKSEQTLVLIDGVEYNDPSDPGRSADLGVLQMDNIERIEILRGNQSVEYAGVGNVILIYTKSGKDPSTQAYMEGGSFGTLRGELASRGVTHSQLDYSFSASGYRTDGISASAAGTEKDGASSLQFTSKIKKKFSSQTHASLSTRYFDARSDLDLVPADTKNYTATQQNFLARIEGQTQVGQVTPQLAFSLRTIHRNSLDYGSTTNTRFFATGDIEKIESRNRIPLSSSLDLTIRGESERHHVTTEGNYGSGAFGMDRSFQQSALAAEISLHSENGAFGAFGARYDYHSAFYGYPIARFSPGYRLSSDTVLRGSIGNGFKAPSLYQLYGEYGEPGLKPEKSWSADLGLEHDLMDKQVHLALTAFYNKFTDLVDFQFSTSRYVNAGKVWTAGVEYSQAIRLLESVRLTSAYTFLEAKDEILDQEMVRRPRHRISNELSWNVGHFQFSLVHHFVGRRTDVDATTFGRKAVDGYHLFHFYSSASLWESGTLFTRVENLFDTKYQAIDGYQSPGLSVFAGLKQSL